MNTLYNKRTKNFSRPISYHRELCTITAHLRFDDECKNKHNTFSITCTITTHDKRRNDPCIMAGCSHDEIAKYFPKLKPLIKWHLVSDDGPMGYVENTLYHLGYQSGPYQSHYMPTHEPNIECARNTAVWPDMPESFICDPDKRMLKSTQEEASKPVRAALEARLPTLMAEFHAAMAAIEWDVVVPRP